MPTTLVLEDNMVVATMLTAMIEKFGHAVMGPCVSEEDAQKLLVKETPTHAILDINLGGGKTSFAVARALIDRNVTVSFSSAYTPDELPDDLAGCTFMPKPITQDELKSFLEIPA